MKKAIEITEKTVPLVFLGVILFGVGKCLIYLFNYIV